MYDERKRPGVRSGAIEAITQRLSNLEHMFLGQGLLLQSLMPHQKGARSFNGRSPAHESALRERVDDLRRTLKDASANDEQALDDRAHESRAATAGTVSDNSISRPFKPQMAASSATDPTLPPDQIVDQLVEWYFANVHRWIPILHVRRFREQLRGRDTRIKINSILIAIVSLCLRFLRPDDMDESECNAMTLRCRHAVILRSMERFSVVNLQALVIIAFDTIGSGRGPSSWSIVGSMARTVDQLHLNAEEDYDDCDPANSQGFLIRRIAFLCPARSWVEAEERRRLFWTIFMMDRFCGVATGWSNSVPAGEVRRRLPCEGAIWEAGIPTRAPFFGCSQKSPSTEQSTSSPGDRVTSDAEEMDAIGGFAFCLEATETLNLVTNFFLRHTIRFKEPQALQMWLMQFKELDLRLVKWVASHIFSGATVLIGDRWRLFLPRKWRNAAVLNQDGIMDPNLTLAHVTHNTAVIQLHQCVAFPPPSLMAYASSLPTASSAETCMTAATEIGTMAQQFLQQSSGITHPQLAFCLFMAGRVLLAGLAGGSADVHPAFDVVSAALSDMAHRWAQQGKSVSSAENLAARLSKRLSEAQAAYMATGPTYNSSSAIDISRPIYEEEVVRSRAPSVRLESDVSEAEDVGQRASHTSGQEVSPSERSLDPFTFSYQPFPLDWGHVTDANSSSSAHYGYNGQNGDVNNSCADVPTNGEWWEGINEMFGNDFQQVCGSVRRSG